MHPHWCHVQIGKVCLLCLISEPDKSVECIQFKPLWQNQAVRMTVREDFCGGNNTARVKSRGPAS